MYPDDVVLMEAFNETLQWETTGTGTDWTADVQDTRVLPVGLGDTDPKALQLRTKDTSPAVGDFVQAYIDIPRKGATVITAEMYLYGDPIDGDGGELTITLKGATSTQESKAVLIWDQINSRWFYEDSSGSQVLLTNNFLLGQVAVWNFVRLGVNIEKGTWEKVIINGEELDISGEAAQTGGATVSASLKLKHTITEIDQSQSFVDNVIIRG